MVEDNFEEIKDVVMPDESAGSTEKSTNKQTVFSKIPKKVKESREYKNIFVDSHLDSAKPGEKYDIPKVDHEILSRYYAIKIKPILETDLPEEIKKDPIFTYESEHMGKEEALKAHLYRKDLKEEELEEAMKIPRKN